MVLACGLGRVRIVVVVWGVLAGTLVGFVVFALLVWLCMVGFLGMVVRGWYNVVYISGLGVIAQLSGVGVCCVLWVLGVLGVGGFWCCCVLVVARWVGLF